MDLGAVSRGGRVEANGSPPSSAPWGTRLPGCVPRPPSPWACSLSSNSGPAEGPREGPEATIQKWTDAASGALTKSLSDPDADVCAVAAERLGLIGERSRRSAARIARVLERRVGLGSSESGRVAFDFTQGEDSTVPRFLSMLETRDGSPQGVRRGTESRPAHLDARSQPDRRPSESRPRGSLPVGPAVGPDRGGGEGGRARVDCNFEGAVDLEMSRGKGSATEWDPACQAAIALGQIARTKRSSPR